MANNNSRNDNKGNNGGIQFLIFALQIFYKMHLLSTSLQAPIPWESQAPLEIGGRLNRRPMTGGGGGHSIAQQHPKLQNPETGKLATGSSQRRAKVGK